MNHHPAHPTTTRLRTEREALARADENLRRNRRIADILVTARRELEVTDWPDILMSQWGDRGDILDALRDMTPDCSEAAARREERWALIEAGCE